MDPMQAVEPPKEEKKMGGLDLAILPFALVAVGVVEGGRWLGRTVKVVGAASLSELTGMAGRGLGEGGLALSHGVLSSLHGVQSVFSAVKVVGEQGVSDLPQGGKQALLSVKKGVEGSWHASTPLKEWGGAAWSEAWSEGCRGGAQSLLTGKEMVKGVGEAPLLLRPLVLSVEECSSFLPGGGKEGARALVQVISGGVKGAELGLGSIYLGLNEVAQTVPRAGGEGARGVKRGEEVLQVALGVGTLRACAEEGLNGGVRAIGEGVKGGRALLRGGYQGVWVGESLAKAMGGELVEIGGAGAQEGGAGLHFVFTGAWQLTDSLRAGVRDVAAELLSYLSEAGEEGGGIALQAGQGLGEAGRLTGRILECVVLEILTLSAQGRDELLLSAYRSAVGAGAATEPLRAGVVRLAEETLLSIRRGGEEGIKGGWEGVGGLAYALEVPIEVVHEVVAESVSAGMRGVAVPKRAALYWSEEGRERYEDLAREPVIQSYTRTRERLSQRYRSVRERLRSWIGH